MTKAEKDGRYAGGAFVMIINKFYNNLTVKNFLKGFFYVVNKEIKKRGLENDLY